MVWYGIGLGLDKMHSTCLDLCVFLVGCHVTDTRTLLGCWTARRW